MFLQKIREHLDKTHFRVQRIFLIHIGERWASVILHS